MVLCTMQDSDVFTGRVVEIRRFVVPLEPYAPADNRERWDLWIMGADAPERQFVVTSRTMPARRGHLVALAMDGGTPVGIVNLTTGGRLNFARSSSPALLQPRDVVVPVALLFVSVFVAAVKDAAGVFLFTVPLAVIYMPLLMIARGLTNAATNTRAEGILDRIERELGRPSGRR
jgi:hypothetical protein